MQFWLNKHSENNNVVIQYQNGLLLASCGKKSYGIVEAQLQNNTNPLELFGKENLSLIPWKSIQKITSDTGNLDIEFKYKLKDEAIIKVSFGHPHSKEQCLSNIVGLLGDKMKMSSDEHSAISFYLSPLLNLALALGSTVLFYKLFQYYALLVGGVWAFLSLFRLIKLTRKSKEINYWTRISKSEKKPSLRVGPIKENKSVMIAVYAHMGIACLIVAVYFGVSIFIKPSVINEVAQTKSQIAANTNKNLQVKTNVGTTATMGMTPLIAALASGDEKRAISLINDGVDLSISHDGKTALDYAIGDSLEKAVITLLSDDAPSSNQQNLLTRVIENGMDLEVIRKIVNAGADVNYTNSSGTSVLAAALEVDAKNSVIKYLLEKGASTKIMIGSQTPVEFANSNGNKKLAMLLLRYQ